jgi:hypothetical protein
MDLELAKSYKNYVNITDWVVILAEEGMQAIAAAHSDPTSCFHRTGSTPAEALFEFEDTLTILRAYRDES